MKKERKILIDSKTKNKKKQVSKAIREYNDMLHQNPKLGVLAENLEWLIDDIYDLNPDPELEKIVLKKIMKRKKLQNKDLEARLVSCWIRSIHYPEVDERILKFVN